MKSGSFKVVIGLTLICLVAVIWLAGCGGGGQTTTTQPATGDNATSQTGTTGTTAKTETAPSSLKPTSSAEATMPDGGALTLYCSLMVGDVYLDGQLIGKPQGSMGRTYYDIEPGVHTVKITSPSWADWTKQVKIETGKKTKLYAYLAYGEDKGGTPRDEIIGPESDSLYGSLRVFCNVTQGNIYVGGEPGGVPQGEVGTTVRGLLPGTYTVTIVADGYAEWSGEVTITTGETAEITAELTPA